MTDGIIQQIIRKYKSNDAYTILPLVEQELIEKIKQAVHFSCKHSAGVCIDCYYLSIRLIGDNKMTVCPICKTKFDNPELYYEHRYSNCKWVLDND